MEQAIQHGANIIVKDWVRLRTRERLLIVSSLNYAAEVQAMQTTAKAVGATAEVLLLDDLHEQVGQYFDDREDAFDPYDAVIGATEYSLITTRAVKRVVQRRHRFLSLPLSTNNGQSLLSYDFLNMSLPKSRIMASIIMNCYQNASKIHNSWRCGRAQPTLARIWILPLKGALPVSSTAAAATATVWHPPAWRCMWPRWRPRPAAP